MSSSLELIFYNYFITFIPRLTTQVGFLGFGYIGMLEILPFGYSGMLAIGAGGHDVFPRHIDIGDNLVLGLITTRVCKILFKTFVGYMHLNMWWLGVISGCFYELNIIVFNFNKIFPYKKSEIYWRSLHLQNSDILVANSHFSYFWIPKFVLCRSHHVCLSNPLSYVAC